MGHSADGWEEVLLPEMERQQQNGKEVTFRADAADLRCAARDYTRTEDWLLTDPQSPKSNWWYSDCTDVGFRVVRECEEGPPVRANREPRVK